MKIKRIVIEPYEYGTSFENQINALLYGSTHVHTMQTPYNDGKQILVYAFYPDEIASPPAPSPQP